MMCRTRTPRDHHDSAEQGRWRWQGHLCQFEPPSDALHESQPLRGLHKAFGAQHPQATEARPQHLGLNPLCHGDFLSLEHIVLMRWRFRVSGTALRTYPGRVRWKQHGWINGTLQRPYQRCIRRQVKEHGLRCGPVLPEE